MAAITAIPNKNTRATTKSLAQWGRRLLQLALMQSSFYASIAESLLDSISGRRLAFDEREASRDLSEDVSNSEVYRQPSTDLPSAPEHLTTLPVSSKESNQSSEAQDDATSSSSFYDAQPGAFVDASASTEIVPPSQNLCTERSDTNVDNSPTDGPGVLETSPDRHSDASAVPPVPLAVVSALDNFQMPRAGVSQMHHTVYGEASRTGIDTESRDAVGDVNLRHLDALKERTGEQADFSVLYPHERGYEALPPRFTRMRDLCVRVLGTIALEGVEGGCNLSSTTITPAIDRVDVKKHFRILFADLVDESFGRLFLGETIRKDDDISLSSLHKLGIGRSETLLSKRVENSNPFDAASFTELLGSQGSEPNFELKGAAKRAARILANNTPAGSEWRQPVDQALRSVGRSSATVSSVFGPAGTGKSTMVKQIASILSAYGPSGRKTTYYGQSYNISCHIYDFSRPNEVFQLRHQVANLRKHDRQEMHRSGRVNCCIIDECTFFKSEWFELLGEFDYIIFVGDPRQMGVVENGHLVRQFVTLAGGSNQALGKVYRHIHPSLFDALNELAYEGRFSLADRSDAVAHDQFQLTTCQDDNFCIATAMLCMAVYNTANKREVCIATQDVDIVNHIQALIDLDPRAYKPLTAQVSIIPLSRIQGIETDALVINPAEIDKYCSDLAGTLKYLFVVLGRVRHHLAIVQPVRTPVPIGSDPPPFSFLLHGLLGETPEQAHQ